MLRADFEILKVDERGVFILDHNRGNMTVTNDAEQVVRYINNLHPGKRIFYRDTEDQWDELTHADGQFLGFKFGMPYDISTIYDRS